MRSAQPALYDHEKRYQAIRDAAPDMHSVLVEIVAQCAAGGKPALSTIERACDILVRANPENQSTHLTAKE